MIQSPAVCPASEVLSPIAQPGRFPRQNQPHIRSPFAMAAPTSRLRRAGLQEDGEPFSKTAFQATACFGSSTWIRQD